MRPHKSTRRWVALGSQQSASLRFCLQIEPHQRSAQGAKEAKIAHRRVFRAMFLFAPKSCAQRRQLPIPHRLHSYFIQPGAE